MFSATNAFAISALSYTLPFLVIVIYEAVRPDHYMPGTYTFNSTLQVLLNIADYASDLGALMCIVGCLLWPVGSK